MAQPISSALGVTPESFEEKGVFDAVLGVDTHLFLDPQRLKFTSITEFSNSHNDLETYFSNLITLLNASTQRDDRAWKEVHKKLIFKELHGVSIGYGTHSSDGSAIGSELASRLVNSAAEILAMGIKDPEIFMLLGLFEEGFGADRLSDMTISIIKNDLYKFTQRIAKELGVTSLIDKVTPDGTYALPKNPYKREGLILLPKELLRDLPIALDRDGIDHVVAVNQELRNRLNQMIGLAWKNKITKRQLRDLIFSNKNNLETLLATYKGNQSGQYDFENDPSGEASWYSLGKKFADANPTTLNLAQNADVNNLEDVIREIVSQFKKNIEVNGLKEALYVKIKGVNRPRHERYSQLVFFAIADTYCKANNIDINREPNAGNGPVDFKMSKGYQARVLVELKLSSNSLIKGYEKQLPAYQESEGTNRSLYVVLRVTRSDTQIKKLMEYRDNLVKEGKTVPAVVVIDARLTRSASRR